MLVTYGVLTPDNALFCLLMPIGEIRICLIARKPSPILFAYRSTRLANTSPDVFTMQQLPDSPLSKSIKAHIVINAYSIECVRFDQCIFDTVSAIIVIIAVDHTTLMMSILFYTYLNDLFNKTDTQEESYLFDSSDYDVFPSKPTSVDNIEIIEE